LDNCRPPLKDQRDVSDLLAQLAAALDDLVGEAGEGHAVGLIAGIGMMQQGHLAVGQDQQRQLQ